MARPEDDRLSAALAALPQDAASAGFTERVMRDLESSARSTSARRRLSVRLAVATAALALVLAAGFFAVRQQSAIESARIEQRAQSLRTEHARLRAELDRLRSMAEETAPVIFLEPAEDFDLVLDLRPAVTHQQMNGFVPASLETQR